MSSLVYLAANIIGASQWRGYSSIDQTISELAALGAPSRPWVMFLFSLYNMLLICFAAGIVTAFSNRRLRAAAAAIGGIGAAGVIAAFFPIQLRGNEWTINETMHVVLTVITVLLIVVTILLGANAGGRSFYWYSLMTLLVTLICGGLAGWSGQRLADEMPTPWLGVTERMSVFAYLAWVAAFAVVLLRTATRRPMPDGMLRV